MQVNLELQGAQEASIDSKGRLAIPVKFRAALYPQDSQAVYLTIKRGTHFLLYPENTWRYVVEEEFPKMMSNPVLRQIAQMMQMCAERLVPDVAGRILLPGHLRSKTDWGSENTVVVSGCSNRLEIWSARHWSATIESILNIDPQVLDEELAKHNVSI